MSDGKYGMPGWAWRNINVKGLAATDGRLMAHAADLCPIDDIFNKSACIAETPVHTTYDAYDDSFLVSALLTARAASWQRARKLALEALGALVLSLDQAGIIPCSQRGRPD